MGGLHYVNITAEIISLIICLIILFYLLSDESRKHQMHRFFISIVCCHIFLLMVDIVIVWLPTNNNPHAHFIARTAYFLSFALGTVILMLCTRYLTVFIQKKTAILKNVAFLPYAALLVCGINLVLILLTQINGMYYVIDDSYVLRPGDFYWLSQVLAFVCIALNTDMIIFHRKSFERREFISLLSYMVLPCMAIIAQNLVDGVIVSIDFAVTLIILIFYAGIQSEQAKQLKQNELELANARIDIMLSQIQPHFLYNTLTTIGCLCRTDGAQAERMISHFANFLRDNMDSLKEKDLIPFERELEHIKIYLDIEKMRFKERLNVVFDLACTDFFLPILTVQPLVENAVRHGITRKFAGGTVTIATHRGTGWIQITVADDGIGFEPNTIYDKRSHVGIENVTNRLDAQCGGKLKIESIKGTGTTATIIIPG